MINVVDKSERTLENYMRAGAELRLLKLLGVNVKYSVQNLTTTPNVRRFNRALSILYDVCAELEDRMRYDLRSLIRRAELSERDCKNVFYVYGDYQDSNSSGTRLPKSKRTIKAYVQAGAEMRIFKTILSKLYVDATKLLPTSKSKRIGTAVNIINAVCAEVESNMVKDFPHISQSYATKFYGPADNPAFYSVNEQANKLTREILESLMPKE